MLPLLLLLNHLHNSTLTLLILLLLNPACCILQLIRALDLRYRLSLRPIQHLDQFGLLTLKIGLPYHGQGVAASSGEVITVFGEGASVSAAIVAVEGVLKHSLVDLPDLYFGVEGSCDHEVVLGVEIHLGDWLPMGIVVLDQSLAAQIVQLYLLISRTACQTGTVGVELAVIDCTQMVVELV